MGVHFDFAKRLDFISCNELKSDVYFFEFRVAFNSQVYLSLAGSGAPKGISIDGYKAQGIF